MGTSHCGILFPEKDRMSGGGGPCHSPGASLQVVRTLSSGWCLNQGSCRQRPVPLPTPYTAVAKILQLCRGTFRTEHPLSPTRKSLPSPCWPRRPLWLQSYNQAGLPGLLFCSDPGSPFLSTINLFSLTPLCFHSSLAY